MSAFYGMVKGERGYATRRGSNNSGITASAQSFNGSVIVSLWYDNDKNLKVKIGTNDGSSSLADNTNFIGTYEEFNKLLNLAQDIKSGRVSIVTHRKK